MFEFWVPVEYRAFSNLIAIKLSYIELELEIKFKFKYVHAPIKLSLLLDGFLTSIVHILTISSFNLLYIPILYIYEYATRVKAKIKQKIKDDNVELIVHDGKGTSNDALICWIFF